MLFLLAIGFFNSGDYKVSRSKEIEASPEQLYKVLGDYGKWNEWSPWANLDPNQTIKVTRQPNTVGHHFEWKGNENVGEGSMTITELKSATKCLQDSDVFETKWK